MGIDGVNVNRADVAFIIDSVAKGGGNVKNLSQTEKRVIAAMLKAFQSGKDVTAPSEKLISSIKGKLAGEILKKTGKTERLKSAWFGIFGIKARIGSEELQKMAAQTRIEVLEWRSVGKFTGSSEFKSKCDQMKEIYSQIKAQYERGGRDSALKVAQEYLTQAKNQPKLTATTTAHSAFLQKVQIPVLEREIASLKKKGNAKELMASWERKIEDWSHHGLMKDRIDKRTVLAQPSLADTIEWYSTKHPGFPDLQAWTHEVYRSIEGRPPEDAMKIIVSARKQLASRLSQAKETTGPQTRAYREVFRLIDKELNYSSIILEGLNKTGKATRDPSEQIKELTKQWATPELAAAHLIRMVRPVDETQNSD